MASYRDSRILAQMSHPSLVRNIQSFDSHPTLLIYTPDAKGRAANDTSGDEDDSEESEED